MPKLFENLSSQLHRNHAVKVLLKFLIKTGLKHIELWNWKTVHSPSSTAKTKPPFIGFILL